jgi:cyclophilin family peptidyl-prolyl cis-trans isomerase
MEEPSMPRARIRASDPWSKRRAKRRPAGRGAGSVARSAARASRATVARRAIVAGGASDALRAIVAGSASGAARPRPAPPSPGVPRTDAAPSSPDAGRPPRKARKRSDRRRSALGHQAARILALATALASGACAPDAEAPRGSNALARIAEGPHEVAVLAVRDLGQIQIELLPELAPATVDHFKTLAAEGFFDGTTFHRVIPGFMIQGGDPNTRNQDPRDDGLGGADFAIPDEFTDYPQRRGTVSLAHKGRPHTAGSQFFILHGDAPRLEGQYTAFGRVVSGMDVVDAISELEIDKYGRYGPRDRPYPVAAVIESVRILPAGEAEAPLAAAGAPAAGGGLPPAGS